MYVLYTDDSILGGPNEKEIEEIIEKMKQIKLDITVEGDLSDFLGVNINRIDESTIELKQPHLIDSIIKDMKFDQKEVKTKNIPMASSKLLSQHPKSPPFDRSFHYTSVIGKMNYLTRGSRPDIAYAVHQCARFAADPRKEHGDAMRWLTKYLIGTRDKGMILHPDVSRSLEVHVDADFAGNWDPEIAFEDRNTARSRHGFFITYAGVLLHHKSQLQTEIALSSTESEFTGLSYALRDAIPIMNTLKEMQSLGFDVKEWRPKVHCKVFEDNSGALEIAKVPKARPRTKHLNVKLHHFRSYVDSGDITIHKIDTLEQVADILTKPLTFDLFVKHRKAILGW
jgi:histone deacetylase 1/2